MHDRRTPVSVQGFRHWRRGIRVDRGDGVLVNEAVDVIEVDGVVRRWCRHYRRKRRHDRDRLLVRRRRLKLDPR